MHNLSDSSAAEEILAWLDQDTGPCHSPVMQLGNEQIVKYFDFSYRHAISQKMTRLDGLLLHTNTLLRSNTELADKLRYKSTARWIYASNKIEKVSTETEAETLEIMACIPGLPILSDAYFAALNTYQLILENDKNDAICSRVWQDDSMLFDWHRKLLQHMNCRQEGEFTTRGVYSAGGAAYPHHVCIPASMRVLRRYTHAMCIYVETLRAPPLEHLRCTFALAAFVAYHFSAIHPFLDGNGRLSRLVAKFILDSLCPVPFPFLIEGRARLDYIEALRQGDAAAPMDAPLSLLDFMLDCAIGHYESLLRNPGHKKHVFFNAASLEELTWKMISSEIDVSTDHQVQIEILFGDMDVGYTADLATDEFIFTLCKDRTF
jgi:hypothetical protein